MELTRDSLKTLGAFVGAPVRKEITWDNGEEQITSVVYIKRISYSSAMAEMQAMTGHKDATAVRIASSVCDKDGQPVFAVEDITGEADPQRGPLSGGLSVALLAAIADVNGLGKPRAKSKSPV
jgi:hypothetical protein